MHLSILLLRHQVSYSDHGQVKVLFKLGIQAFWGGTSITLDFNLRGTNSISPKQIGPGQRTINLHVIEINEIHFNKSIQYI